MCDQSAGGSNDATTRAPADGGRAAPRDPDPAEQDVGRRYQAVVALEEADSVAILAGPPWRRVKRISVARGPHNVDASPRGDVIAVTSPPADVVTMLRRDGRLARVRVSGSPHDSVFTADGRRLWVTAEQGRRLVQLSVRDGHTIRSVLMPGPPHDLTLVRSRELWVTIDGSSAVERRSAIARRCSRASAARRPVRP
jgi:hypothetical protein